MRMAMRRLIRPDVDAHLCRMLLRPEARGQQGIQIFGGETEGGIAATVEDGVGQGGLARLQGNDVLHACPAFRRSGSAWS
ncbi:hypothetical protein ABB22_11330 [Stenotrophomonas nitritireducens]|uniref:Uncharacterized protein n=1 Tax=Stenotrophomonas nitritireducens TaxID=83617 RepID=A0ABR5NIU2_9GAMM|nr:hypothetical protein ABB22_11330 [Stenotrophomonas nitritireducens]